MEGERSRPWLEEVAQMRVLKISFGVALNFGFPESGSILRGAQHDCRVYGYCTIGTVRKYGLAQRGANIALARLSAFCLSPVAFRLLQSYLMLTAAAPLLYSVNSNFIP